MQIVVFWCGGSLNTARFSKLQMLVLQISYHTPLKTITAENLKQVFNEFERIGHGVETHISKTY